MFFDISNFLKTTALSVVLVSSLSMPAISQDIDGLPPQPAQSILPEDVTFDAEVFTVVEDEPLPIVQGEVVPPPVPTVELDELVDEPPEDVTQDFASQQPPEPVVIPHSGTYYDSDSIGPSELGASTGPRKVDPRYEPGSSFVIVKKDASSSSRQANIVAAQRALKLGRYAAALELYEKLYKKNPKNLQVVMGLAVAQQHNGFNESAIATYEEILKISPRHTGAMVNLMGLLERNQPQVAYNKLQKLWNRDGQNPAVAAQLGLVSAKLGNYEEASRYLGIAASLEPSSAQHHYNLAIVLDQAKSPKSAIEYYQKALEIDVSSKNGGSLPRDQIYDRLAELRRL